MRAGQGGDEAGLFARDLYRMYSKYATSQGWNQKVLDSNMSDIGGYKEMVVRLRAELERRGGSDPKHDWTDEERACLMTRYEELKPIWLEAKKIAKRAQKSREKTRKASWRDEVLRAYPYLPIELVERFATPRAEDAKPSNIAIIHAKNLCGITFDYSVKTLQEEVRAWKLKTSN